MPAHLVVGSVVDKDDLLYTLDFGGFVGYGLDVASGDETGDGAAELHGGGDGGQGGHVQLSFSLLEHGEGGQ